MLGTTPFYHDLLKKYVTIFGAMFNNIMIMRDNDAQQFKVPLSYGPREKFLARLKEDQKLEKDVAITLPRISFHVVSLTYDPQRKRNSINRIVARENIDKKTFTTKVNEPVPYNINIELSVMSKTIEEGTKIVEQIIPYFTPEWVISAKLIDELPDLVFDIPIVLNGVNTEDMYDGSFEERRVITWNFDFTIRALFFGPIKDKKIIKLVRTNIITTNSKETITVTPGLTNRGTPTYFNNNQLVQAQAEVIINNGKVVDVKPTVIGIGYENPTVTVDPPSDPNGVQAIVEPVIQEYSIVDYKIISEGSGYTTTPNITISPPDMQSIDYMQIDETDNYGYIITVE